MSVIFSIFFGLIFPLMKKHSIPMWPWILALCFFLPAVFWPQGLSPVYRLWMKVGAILGFINTTIILTVVFFVIFTPASFILRLLGKDPMKRKYQAKTTSYREIKTENNSGLKMEEPY